MARISQFELPSGAVIHVEAEPTDSDRGYRSASGLQDTIRKLDVRALVEPISNLLDTVLKRFLESHNAPSEITITAGVKFGAEGQFIVAKGTAEANLSISVKYLQTNRPDNV